MKLLDFLGTEIEEGSMGVVLYHGSLWRCKILGTTPRKVRVGFDSYPRETVVYPDKVVVIPDIAWYILKQLSKDN